MKNINPPRAPLRFFRWFCHPKLRDHIEGDLMELYEERVKEIGKRHADLRFMGDVLLLCRRGIIRPTEGYKNLNNYGMFKNYFKVGIRNILKYKVFSFINVFGLALAMSVCMLIILMLADRNRYDQFHNKKERIYRILSDYLGSRQPYATSPFPLASALKTEYPVVEESTHLHPGVGGDVTYNQHVEDMRGYFADASFFKVFSFDLEEGNANTALVAPNSMVIDRTLANRLFKDENPLGKTVEFSDRGLPFPQRNDGIGTAPVSWGSFTITGVINMQEYRSHITLDVLVSSSSMQKLYSEKKIANQTNDWEFYWRTYTYVLLDSKKTKEDLSAALTDLVAHKYAGIKNEETKGFKLSAQNLRDVQLGLMGNDTDNRLPLIGYYFLSLLALVIMVSACLNYTNLSIARALTRAKEIGVRKVTGANRKNLLYQFLSESILTSLLALTMAIGMLLFVKRAFMGLWLNQFLSFELSSSTAVYLIYVGFAVLIGVAAGIYPAWYLSKYQPIQALKNNVRASRSKFGIRKVLSVSQFVISLFFITTSILIFNQFKHFQAFDYGFNSKNIVNIELQGVDYKKLTRELSTVPGVSTISASDVIPATGRTNGTSFKKAGSSEEYAMIHMLLADEKFVGNMGLQIIAGRHLQPSAPSSDRFVLVNETTTKKLGYRYPAQIIGEVFETKFDKEPLEVVGVVSDFRYSLLINQDKIGPLMIRNQPGGFMYLNVRIASNNVSSTVAKLEEKWKQIDPVHSFKFEFYDDQLAFTHRGIFDAVTILGFMSFLAIVIACLGLLGMATYMAERRMKEVGIRKVLGAEDRSIALLLSKEFLRMLMVSICIGAPLSFMINNVWLQRFPNRVEFGVGTVGLGVAALLVLGIITIGSQTIAASKRNPVDAIKMD